LHVWNLLRGKCVSFVLYLFYMLTILMDQTVRRRMICIKGKVIPLQALTGPKGSRRLRLQYFKTIGTWRWQGCQPYASAAFTPRKYS
jgi:hypothetical protein